MRIIIEDATLQDLLTYANTIIKKNNEKCAVADVDTNKDSLGYVQKEDAILAHRNTCYYYFEGTCSETDDNDKCDMNCPYIKIFKKQIGYENAD